MELIQAYKTPDGKIFESENKAEEYVQSKICEIVAQQVELLLKKERYTKTDVLEIVTTIFPDYDTSCQLINELARTISTFHV